MLHVHHADHADRLVVGLARVLADPMGEVFATEQVAVHSRGLERWLAQRLSHHLGTGAGQHDGVCAGVAFPFPGRLIDDALSAATDLDPMIDPWRGPRLAWQLLALLAADPGLAVGTPLARHLHDSGGTPADGRFAAVRVVANLFDRYAVHRPEMLRRWATGVSAAAVHADGRPLPPGAAWQATLWRAVRDHLGVPSPAERIADAVQRLEDDPASCPLPSRVSLFGLTALPASYLVVLRALARHRDVHLFLLHPSPGLWDRVDALLRTHPVAAPPRRDEDPTADLVRNPLLRAWGRDAREMQVVLRTTAHLDPRDPPGTAPSGVAAGNGSPDNGSPDNGSGDTAFVGTPVVRGRSLLHRIQADVRADLAPEGPTGAGQLDLRPPLDPEDLSLQVHACHGPTRQVEVLRDVLLHAFAADPTLEPRDVLVLCPDIDTFAPVVEAVFAPDADALQAPPGLRPGHLRVRVADRSVTGTNPLLRVVADVLRLADGRVTASDVRDLAATEPVRARFDLDARGLERLDTWIRELGVRWGLDAEHRRGHGIETDANTWAVGLQRLLVGVAVADEDQRTVGEVVPHDDVAGDEIELTGRVAELVARLADACRSLAVPRSMTGWRRALEDAVEALTDTRDAPWQRVQLATVLDDLVRDAGGEADDVELSLPEFRDLIGAGLGGVGGRASHRTGDLTVCSLVPMRSVPHRVVCLLGMDDGAFPRRSGPDGDDLLELDPRTGDRDARTEDRQLLLDALLAADERLVITYAGRDERTNDARPPAVPVGELLDVVDRTVRGHGDGARASARLTVHHPLHVFDPRNFVPGALGIPGRALGSDPVDLEGARALSRPDRREAVGLMPDPLQGAHTGLFAPLGEDLIELDDLLRAVIDPIATLLDTRLGLRFPRVSRLAEDDLPVELDGLATHAIGRRLLAEHLLGLDPDRSADLERRRGTLPPGALAAPVLDEVSDVLDAVLAAVERHGAAGALHDPGEVDVLLPDGRRLIGGLGDVVQDATAGPSGSGPTGVLRTVTFSRLGERDRLRAWVRLVAATAAQPERPWRAVTVARVRKGAPRPKNGPEPRSSQALLAVLADDPDQRRSLAMAELLRLVELRDLALTRPVPLATRTSAAFATAEMRHRTGGRATAAAAADARWKSGDHANGESSDPAYVHVFGAGRSTADLLDARADEHETGDGWDTQEASRFGRWALRLWAPLLTHETVVDS